MPDARAVALAVRLCPPLAALGPIRKAGGSDVADREMWRANPSYEVIPLRALGQVDALRRRVRRELGAVRTPLLVIHALHDHVAPPASADEIVRRVASPLVRQVALPRSFHIVAMDLERARVADEVIHFLAPLLDAPVA
jgi:carboxylesterase